MLIAIRLTPFHPNLSPTSVQQTGIMLRDNNIVTDICARKSEILRKILSRGIVMTKTDEIVFMTELEKLRAIDR